MEAREGRLEADSRALGGEVHGVSSREACHMGGRGCRDVPEDSEVPPIAKETLKSISFPKLITQRYFK